ncbi:ABC transporter substrate-binding protein [Spirochaetia bacterium]|nr:ABC transporter substrate-binding protein [Spirochaetia bacterium]
MKRTKGLVLLFVLALVVSLLPVYAGGGSQSGGAQGGGIPAATGKFSWTMSSGETINVLFNQHPYADEIIKKIPDFEKLTGIKVQYSVIPESNYFDKVTTQLNSRSGDMDIFMTGPYQIWEYASAGYMQDLDEFLKNPAYISDDFDVQDLFPSILNALRWDAKAGHLMGTGPLWGFPMGYESNELVYNKRIFAEHNIKVPTNTDELLAAAKALKGHSGPNTYGVALRGERGWATPITAYFSLYYSWGAKDFEVKNGKLSAVVNSPEAVAMTDWYVNLIKSGGSSTWGSATWYSSGAELGAGTAAMLIDSSQNCFGQTVKGNSKEAENLVFTTIPVPRGKSLKSNLWVWAMAMNASSKKKVPAWLFMQYFTGKEYQQFASVDGRIVQTIRSSSFNQPAYQNIVSTSGFIDTFNGTVAGTTLLPTPQYHFFEIGTEWSATLQDLVEGKYASTQQAMDALKKKLDDIVSDIEVTN